jgi:kynureninase
MTDITEKEWAILKDTEDELSSYRSAFVFPKSDNGHDKIYFCGNSLGLQPKSSRDHINQVLDDWAAMGVEGHSKAHPAWMPYHEILTDQMAAVVGAKPEEVVIMNSLTVNIHLLMVSFYRPSKNRYKILIEKPSFPSDRYAVISQITFHGYDPSASLVEIGPREGEYVIRQEDLEAAIEEHGETLALIWLGNVNYYSGQAFDMARIASLGHQKGSVVGFDLAHGAGNLDCDLHASGVDFAAWCTYKYLNSGPGGVSGIFVHERHRYNPDLPRFAGWWGHDKSRRFLMEPDFSLLPGAEGWQLSNPPILPMASLKASLDIFAEAGMSLLHNKRVSLSQYLYDLLSTLSNHQVEVITPGDPAQRGAQISMRLPSKNKELFHFLASKGVVADWREPDVIRLAPVPLYNSYMDVWQFYQWVKEYFSR